MKYRKYGIAIIILLILQSVSELHAQQLPVSNQYFENKYALSPVLAGHDENSMAFLGYREQWTGMPESPVTATASLYHSVSRRVWLGAEVVSHQSSIFNNIFARVSYTYRLPIGENQHLSFSLDAGVLQNSISLDDVIINDPNDPLLTGSDMVAGLSFRSGAGLMYQHKQFFVGVSVPSLFSINNEYSTTAEKNALNTEGEFMAFSGVAWQFREKWQLQPMAVFRYHKNAPLNFDVLAKAVYDQKYWAGLYYRTESTIGITVGGHLIERLILNYTYAFENNGYTPYTAGSHEFSLGYILKHGTGKRSRKVDADGRYPDAIRYNKKYRR